MHGSGDSAGMRTLRAGAPHHCCAADAPLQTQAVWAHFHEFGSQRVLCLLHRLSITSILPSGAVQETPLLQPCTAIWPLPRGLLLVVSCFVATAIAAVQTWPHTACAAASLAAVVQPDQGAFAARA
jgi:hypothetical protein